MQTLGNKEDAMKATLQQLFHSDKTIFQWSDLVLNEEYENWPVVHPGYEEPNDVSMVVAGHNDGTNPPNKEQKRIKCKRLESGY